MSLQETRFDNATAWLLGGMFVGVVGTAVSVALRSIDPFIYTYVPAQLLILRGYMIIREGDDQSVDIFVTTCALSLLFGVGATASHFALPADNQVLTYILGIGAMTLFTLPYIYFVIDGLRIKEKENGQN